MPWKTFKLKEIFKTRKAAEKALKKERGHAVAHGAKSSDLRIKKIKGKNFPWEKARTGWTIEFFEKPKKNKKRRR